MIFNDNMVAQAVAAPLREREREGGGGGGGGGQGLISVVGKDVYQALLLTALTPIRRSMVIKLSFILHPSVCSLSKISFQHLH